ncbi:MAG: restriction endonuclease subunit S [Methanobrevibacter woesei]|nr:restriction endonuclease subunit S [Methanobrevibacter woesei]
MNDGTHKTPDYVNNGIPFFSVENITNSTPPKKISIEEHNKLIKRCHPKKGDILLTRIGTLAKSKIIDWDYEFSIYVSLALINSIKIYNFFLYQYLKTPSYQKDFFRRSLLLAVPQKINLKDLNETTIKYPSNEEQYIIGNFLLIVDKKIELMEKKYDSLKLYKKGFIQQIFSQEIRFKNSENMFSDWKNRKLSDFLFEHKLKSTDNEEVYSVSVHKGLVNQIEHLGRDFSSKNTSKYNLVKPGDIVYTKSPTGEFPLGIIKQSRINKDVIVSPLYGVFSPETFDLGYILNEYFESEVNTYNYLHPIVQKGAKNTMNISNKTFLSKTLFVPTDKNEQKLIHTILAKINKKIDSVEQQLEKIKEFKKYLLQQMFV